MSSNIMIVVVIIINHHPHHHHHHHHHHHNTCLVWFGGPGVIINMWPARPRRFTLHYLVCAKYFVISSVPFLLGFFLYSAPCLVWFGLVWSGCYIDDYKLNTKSTVETTQKTCLNWNAEFVNNIPHNVIALVYALLVGQR